MDPFAIFIIFIVTISIFSIIQCTPMLVIRVSIIVSYKVITRVSYKICICVVKCLLYTVYTC